MAYASAPSDPLFFFDWFRTESEEYWASVEVDNSVYGYQIQPGTRWLAGLTESEISSYEQELGFTFPDELRLFLSRMNGTDRNAINVFGGSGEPNAFGPGYYSYPRDISAIKALIEFQYEAFGVNHERVEREQIPHIVPLVGHRFLVVDRCTSRPVLSMYETDVIIYARDLPTFLVNDVLRRHAFDDNRPADTVVPFWVND